MKKEVKLSRIKSNKDMTLGFYRCYSDGRLVHSFPSLELPWKENKNSISCIPAGEYDMIQIERPAGRGWALLLQNVPNRWAILTHAANFTRQIKGCIIIGLAHEDIDNDGIMDVSSSRRAMEMLQQWVGNTQTLPITITDDYHIGDLDPKTEKTV